MRPLLNRLAVVVLVVVIAACGTRARNTSDPSAQTYVRVTNQSFWDMNVYVLRSEARIRLGTVNGNRTERFTLPRSVVTGSTAIRFMADPIGSSRVSQSFEITVVPGDEVSITIPPPA